MENRLGYLFLVISLIISLAGKGQIQNLSPGKIYLEKSDIKNAEIFFSRLLEETSSYILKGDIHYEIAKIYNVELYYNLSFEHCQKAIEFNASKFQVKRVLQLISHN